MTGSEIQVSKYNLNLAERLHNATAALIVLNYLPQQTKHGKAMRTECDQDSTLGLWQN